MSSEAKRIKVLLVDDHELVRQGLVQMLATQEDIQVAAESTSSTGALEQLERADYDVVVMDISMPGPNTKEALLDILERWPGQRVLMISMHPEDQYAMHYIKAGAAGYVTKSDAPKDLAQAIRTVANNECYISAQLSAQLKELENGGGI